MFVGLWIKLDWITGLFHAVQYLLNAFQSHIIIHNSVEKKHVYLKETVHLPNM